MRIDTSRIRRGTSEVPPECQALIDRLRHCSRLEFLEELSRISTWTFGKCELYHWIQVLDIFDCVLEDASKHDTENRWALKCDKVYNIREKKLLLWVLHFTTLLIEHSFSRHLYNSMEHLLTLLMSSDMSVVLGVLNLLYMFSKRSNFITRLANDKRQALILRLHYLAESWGGKENGFGLAECCMEEVAIPISATTLHFEFHKDFVGFTERDPNDKNSKCNTNFIHVENVDKLRKTPAEIMYGLLSLYHVPPERETCLFTHVRLANHFSFYNDRLLCVQARLQALSVLVYSNALHESVHLLLYNGLLEELVEVIELDRPHLVEIRSAALRTLTSIIHLDRNPHFPKKYGSRLNNIIDVTGANQYHGFLPALVRSCILSLTKPRKRVNVVGDEKVTESPQPETYPDFPLPLATALFSFLYHLASYEIGGEALVSCGMMESLLQVINWHGVELEHITFVTRAVRVIDLITNMDMQAFHTHGGLQSFINRLDVEVSLCSKDQSVCPLDESCSSVIQYDYNNYFEFKYTTANAGRTCLPQRAALLKSMLNFLKKALQDGVFSDSVRHVMEGMLPSSLKHIIANAEFYGPSLFLLATDLVTVYVFQEPTLLTSLQDNGLTDVILHGLLLKDVPATREVLGSLPNVFSALCLNSRGLSWFSRCKPFDRLFKLLLSPNYLSAMRRRRSSDPLGDTASNLGNAMDELMRHQPTLKADATKAIISLLSDLCHLGTDPKYICWRPHSKSEFSPTTTARTSNTTEGSSDEEDDDEEEASTSSHTAQSECHTTGERIPIALIDYIINIMKFLDAILSNNSTDDHCKEFVAQGGLTPLLKVLGLPNLPVDAPITVSAQAVASVCKSIINLAHEPAVLKQGMEQLRLILVALKPMYGRWRSCGSKLLHELVNVPHLETAFSTASYTPILHNMAAAHSYVLMFVHVCRTGQAEIRNFSLQHWGSEEGMLVLKTMAELYTSLVWESTLLLALCSDDTVPLEYDCGREDIEKLSSFPIFDKTDPAVAGSSRSDSENVIDPPFAKPTHQQLKFIKPLLGASSRLGRALAELFGLLVKLCVGTPLRQRRAQGMLSTPSFPGPHARAVATALNYLLASGLDAYRLPPSPVSKFKLTFLICSVGFTSPMLFDEKRYPYHLMLQKFVAQDGEIVFFNTFKWALSAEGTIPLKDALEHPNLPEGTGEFLDAWLMLLEKMVNPKAILDSPHIMNNKSGGPLSLSKFLAFNPLRYLIRIHKLAFEAMMLLWGRKPLHNYGVRMTESILTILRHILRGEKVIKDRLEKGEDDKFYGAFGNRVETDVNQEYLRQLMDMGFTREHACEALIHTLTVEQATEYLLSSPPNFLRAGPSTEADTEDDQVIQAIALSLDESNAAEKSKEEGKHRDNTPLSAEAINEFADNALDVCLDLIRNVPETIYKVCELLGTVMKRNGPVFRDVLLKRVLSDIRRCAAALLHNANNKGSIVELHREIIYSQRSLTFGYYIHLYTLFFEIPYYYDMRVPCGFAVFNMDIIQIFVQLIVLAQKVMLDVGDPTEPKWLTPVLLLLDSLGKVSVCTQRKRYMHMVTTRTWRWYDVSTGQWTPYSIINNKIINDAYWNGEIQVKVSCGRRRYTVIFANMVQSNDETGNTRPVSMTPLALAREPKFNPDSPPSDIDENDVVVLSEREHRRCVAAPGLTARQTSDIVTSCVKLMHLSIDKDLLHAIMCICSRLTRDFRNGRIFVEEGGVKCLLKLKQNSAFNGYGTLATILIRHTLEEPVTLSYAIERVIRGITLVSIPSSYREMIYMTRQIGGALTRSPETFYEVGRNILRIDCSIFRKIEDVDTRLPLRSETTSKTTAPLMEEPVCISVVYDLLDALLQPLEQEDAENADKPPPPPKPSQPRESVYQRTTINDLLNNASEILNVPNTDDTSSASPLVRSRFSRAPNDPNVDARAEELARRPMLAKHCILKILADAVMSYASVARLITDYVYKADRSEFLTEDTSALAFIIDKIMPMTENIADRDCSIMGRVLIAVISFCNNCPDAQATLVNEVKAALFRALLLPESFEKHTQIQIITGIITTMIDNCPTTFQLRMFRGNSSMNGQINNIVRLILRKGLYNDLARVIHCVDLSSPHFAVTVNSALKPMESLSRIINQPMPLSFINRMHKKSQHTSTHHRGTTTQSATTSTDATNAQGEEVVEDAENTDHDVSVVASSMEANPAVASHQEDDGTHVFQIVEQLLERGSATDGTGNTGGNNESNRSYSEVASTGRSHTMDIDEDVNLGFDQEQDATEELMSTDSGDSDSNASDQVDEENDDNEVEDDVDENEDNDENNYEDDENQEIVGGDREEDILMIQYADPDLDEMVRWNENGFAVPLFEDVNRAHEQVRLNFQAAAVASHPLLISRHNSENGTGAANRNQRTNRARRYQYVQLNSRNSNPPVILQRLLGPVAQNLSISANELLNSAGNRDAPRVVVMDNFGLIPTNEEQIDLVDQAGYLFGPSVTASLNRIPSVLYWWNEESKLLDYESACDVSVYMCHKLLATLIPKRNFEMLERQRKREEEEKLKNATKKLEAQKAIEEALKPAFVTCNANIETSESENHDHTTTDPLRNVQIPTRPPYRSDHYEIAALENITSDSDTFAETLHLQQHSNVQSHEPPRVTTFGGLSGSTIMMPRTLDTGRTESYGVPTVHPVTTLLTDTRNDELSYQFSASETFEDSSDEQMPENLSEIERVASVGISGRRLLDPEYDNYDEEDEGEAETEPYEEPPAIANNQYGFSGMNLISNLVDALNSTVPHNNGVHRPIRIPATFHGFDAFNPNDVITPGPTQGRRSPQHLYRYSNDPNLVINLLDSVGIPPELELSESDDDEEGAVEEVPAPAPVEPQPVEAAGETTAQTEPHQSTSDCQTGSGSESTSNATSQGEARSDSEPDGDREQRAKSKRNKRDITESEADSEPEVPIESKRTKRENAIAESASDPDGGESSVVEPTAPEAEADDAEPETEPEPDRSSPVTAQDSTHTPVNSPPSNVSNPSSNSPHSDSSAESSVDNQNEDNEQQSAGGNRSTEVGSSSSSSAASGTEQLPEGVDPSFLEALPPEMRSEVLEQYRLLHSQENNAVTAASTSEQDRASSPSEVSPEFLAALPPALQEEVLSQQRLEQQRQAAARANPNEPVDAGAFFQTLQPSLRTMILADIEDSQMSALPPDLAAEAETLRRDWEARNRQMVQERFFQNSLTTIIRHSARGRLNTRVTPSILSQRAQWGTFGHAELFQHEVPGATSSLRTRGRQLLDHESLSCILVLLFTDDQKLNVLRLHRVIRNLCYHPPTRDWIICALLSIIDRSVYLKTDDSLRPQRRAPRPGPLTSKLITDTRHLVNGANWLNVKMEAALGCHANVFMINRTGKRTERGNQSSVTIHSHAAPVVCRNALDLFISLSKNFPACLLPIKWREDKEDKTKPPPTSSSPSKTRADVTDFWDMLYKLDATSSKKGKYLPKTLGNLNMHIDPDYPGLTFEESAFGQLLCMLSSSVICKSTQLTDKLLRLLSVITTGMLELTKSRYSPKNLGKLPRLANITAPESALSLAVNVLTYKSCSEEGLEDATTLLLNLANCSMDMSYTILNLLLNGAQRIGEVVKGQISNMLDELRKLNTTQIQRVQDDSLAGPSRGTMANRFTKETVVIVASSKVKTVCDLQLPCMSLLTSKTSNQLFFLRVLRVIIQIRDAIKNSLKKDEENVEPNSPDNDENRTGSGMSSPPPSPSAHAPGVLTVAKYDKMDALSEQLRDLEGLWETLSECLFELEHTPDDHAVLVLQPAVEAFFLVHSPQQSDPDDGDEAAKPSSSTSNIANSSENSNSSTNSSRTDNSENTNKSNAYANQLKFLGFAEKHRTVLNQILRQTTTHLADGPFCVLVDHTKVLDFDVKRKYFRTELERLDKGLRREETAIHVRRSHVFEDSFRELYRRKPEEWKNRFYIVFEEEEGQDAGGLLREWYMIISRDIFNPMYALFTTSPGDRVTYMINPASHYNPTHLQYYKFVGRLIAKAIYDNKLLECYFTRAFYKQILGALVSYTDMESEDYTFYRGLVYLMQNNVKDIGYDLTFSTEINEFGVTETRDLIPNGQNVPVTEDNKMEYVNLSCQMKMTGAIRQQISAFLEGFYDIIPKRLISIFNEQELELLISGLPNIDIDDLKANTEYHKYQVTSLQIQWFWRALRSFDQADRAKFLQFVTGTSKVPLQGFAHLEGMNGVQKFQIHRDDRSTDRLPSAHTCFNQLDLPVYETFEKLRTYLLKAIHECSEGFGFA